MDQPTAEHALRRLEPLVGEWSIEATWPDGKPWPGGGTVTFEWHASGANDLPDTPDSHRASTPTDGPAISTPHWAP